MVCLLSSILDKIEKILQKLMELINIVEMKLEW